MLAFWRKLNKNYERTTLVLSSVIIPIILSLSNHHLSKVYGKFKISTQSVFGVIVIGWKPERFDELVINETRKILFRLISPWLNRTQWWWVVTGMLKIDGALSVFWRGGVPAAVLHANIRQCEIWLAAATTGSKNNW